MNRMQAYAPFVGRILMALPFLSFASYKLGNWEMMLGWLQFKSLPMPSFLLGAAIATEFVCGLLLIAGFKVRWAAAVLTLYLIPVHLSLHNYWTLEIGPERQGQVEQFGKGLMIMGGLLFVAVFGPGPISVDRWLRRRRAQRGAAAESGPDVD